MSKIYSFYALGRFGSLDGFWLLFLPCLLAGLLAGGERLGFIVIVFGFGAFFMRSAGCVWNDIIDRRLDSRVSRTRMRPLASGALSVTEALLFLAGLLGLALASFLLLSFAAQLWVLAILPLIILYPFAKRFFVWPQLVLGIAFNWGVFPASIEASARFDSAIFCLWVSGVFWTLVYDTVYGFQDIEDDAILGVHSSALWLGYRRARRVLPFFALASLFFLACALWLRHGGGEGFSMILLILSFAGVGVFWFLLRFRFEDASRCLIFFRLQKWVGLAACGVVLYSGDFPL